MYGIRSALYSGDNNQLSEGLIGPKMMCFIYKTLEFSRKLKIRENDP